jgi:hypothetical protein
MSDEELVKRLRDPDEMTCADGMEAADRIEALTAKNEMLGREVNIARYGQPNFAWSIHKAAMADLEAKLAKAMTHVMDYSNDPHLVQFARTTLAEIEGEKG